MTRDDDHRPCRLLPGVIRRHITAGVAGRAGRGARRRPQARLQVRAGLQRDTLSHMSERPAPKRALREVRSFRLARDVVERLDRYAASVGSNRNTMAERFLEEALRLVEHPGIVFRDGPAGRRPGLAASGLDVWEVVETVDDNARSVADAAEHLGIAQHLVAAAMRYYAAFPEEIDAWIAANHEMADRELELFERQRQRLA